MENFENGEVAQENLPQAIVSEITEFVEDQGHYVKVLEQTDDVIRFQIWKDPAGLPLMESEGLEEVMNGIGANCDSILGNTMEIIHIGGAGT